MDSQTETNKKTILLIEDEYYIHDIYQHTLLQAGFNVLSATNGSKGYELAHQKPDLILLDIMLPGVNGLEVLKLLKKDAETKDIPVVLITNLGHKDIIQEAFDNGAQGYLLKVQTNLKELVDYIHIFLDNPSYKMNIESLSID